MTDYRFARTGRSVKALVTLLAVWALLLVLWIWLDAAGWVLALVGLATVPALFDFVTARPAGLAINRHMLSWWSGRQTAEVAIERIDHVRLETRLDFSPRVRLVLQGGKRLVLPQDSLPEKTTLEQAFAAYGVRVERHPFALLS